MSIDRDLFECFLPEGIFEWFEITEAKRDAAAVRITLTEKDVPPLALSQGDKKIIARKFHDITVTDFPLRGRRTLLTFRRRYWKLEDEKEYLKRDIDWYSPARSLPKSSPIF